MHDDSAGSEPADVSMSQLTDLAAGLLDEDLAADVRQRGRRDLVVARQLAALDRVRRHVTAIAADPASAPDVPAEVTARIGSALRALAVDDDGDLPQRA